MQKVKLELIMLPTEKCEVGSIMKYVKKMPFHDPGIDFDLNSLVINKNPNITGYNEYWEAQEIYLMKNNNNGYLKIGDLCFVDGVFEIITNLNKDFSKSLNGKTVYKVFASSSKVFQKECNIPLLSQSFKEEYVKDYNEGHIYKEVFANFNKEGKIRTYESDNIVKNIEIPKRSIKEEMLDRLLKQMIKEIPDRCVEFKEMKQVPEYKKILDLMTEYSNHRLEDLLKWISAINFDHPVGVHIKERISDMIKEEE